MFGTASGYGLAVARQRIEDLHRDAERHRLLQDARRRRRRGRRATPRGWLRPAPAGPVTTH
jgi:hypothetical protein